MRINRNPKSNLFILFSVFISIPLYTYILFLSLHGRTQPDQSISKMHGYLPGFLKNINHLFLFTLIATAIALLIILLGIFYKKDEFMLLRIFLALVTLGLLFFHFVFYIHTTGQFLSIFLKKKLLKVFTFYGGILHL